MQQTLTDLVRILQEKGISTVLLLFVMFICYRYFEVKIEQIQQEFNSNLLLKGYKMQGEARLQNNEKDGIYTVELTAVKVFED